MTLAHDAAIVYWHTTANDGEELLKEASLLKDLFALELTRERLAASDLSEQAAAARAELLAVAARALADNGLSGETSVKAFFVPGRIEVLGKHTDYAGGSSITAVPERGICVVVAPRRDATVRLFNPQWQQSAQFNISPGLTPAAGKWTNYPMTVARRLARNFDGPLCGADIAIASDLPSASGMSSSSAIVVATFLALAGVNKLYDQEAYKSNIASNEDLAGYLGTCENGQTFGSLVGDKGVGTFGGSEDHTAMLCSLPRAVKQYAYCPVRLERTISIPGGYIFAIGSSGVVAQKTGAAQDSYNRASRLLGAVTEVWRAATGRDDPHVAAALASSPDAADRLRDVLSTASHDSFTPEELTARFEHFYAENQQIIPAAGDALERGDLPAFGELVDRSQAGAEKLLGNQVPETIFLARAARETGAVAASAFGAGFGGSVWALVPENQADELLQQWRTRYEAHYSQHSDRALFFLTHAGPAAFELQPRR